MPLQEYARKRDFKKTPEPGSKVKKNKSHLMFVVQEHQASHLHYDFRLEMDGVLKSWAVPKGPSLDPHTKRLAVEVEDHPLAYGKFEGTIPDHQYGAGKVYIWDTGVWKPDGDPLKSLKKGHLEFELRGDKLKGRWLLLRTRPQAGKSQWLLIKRTDDYVVPGDVASEVADQPTPHQAATAGGAWRSKKAKVSKKRSKGELKEMLHFITPQLAQLTTEPPDVKGWLHETKFDGYRIQALLENGEVKLFTRNEKDWTEKYLPIAQDLKKLKVKSAILDGEIVVLDKGGRSDFQLLQNAMQNHDMSSLRYYIFDMLFINGEDLRALPLEDRKAQLKKILRPLKGRRIFYSEHIKNQAKKFLKAACDSKLEGIISKMAKSPSVSGRNSTWLKSKCRQQQEFVIGGFTEGTGQRQGFGALLLGVFDGDQLRYVGKVGTGFTTESLLSLHKVLKLLEQDNSPFDVKSPRGRGLHWVQPKLAAEIVFANWTEDQFLRVPVFHGLREDKPAKKISQEIPLTHPDKILYGKEHLTKLDVAQYYISVASLLLPHMQDRPLSLLRCPEGTAKACFFQKHGNDSTSSSIHSISVSEKNQKRNYMTVDTEQGLLALVQMGAFELHVWNSRDSHLENPDQIVMDFDPDPSVPFRQVVHAALELKSILDQLHLKSFVKVTGGKGLHVHIPVLPIYTWDQIRSFSESLALEMVSREPTLYTANMAKKARTGKIFIDYLRNVRGATAVLPYSLRARTVSSVAMPVAWSDLKKIKGADIFTLEKSLRYLRKRKKDPWADYYKTHQKVSILKKSYRSFLSKVC